MRIPRSRRIPELIEFTGGYDVDTAPIKMLPGTCREAQNFVEDIDGGYYTVPGYERYDGQAKPSDAAYATLVVAITGTVAVDDVLTDAAGTSYGTVIALPADSAVMTKLTGTFSTGNIKVGVDIVGTCVGAQVVDGATTTKLHAQYKNLAADVYRADITAIPGSGNILGVVSYDDVQYAFRNNAGGAAVDMYKSSAAGWVQVALGRELSFTSGGTVGVAEGNEIEGETSGAKATVTRVVHESGTFAGGDAAGRIIFASQTGTFESETIKVGTDLNIATIAADSSAITFAVPTGRFEFSIINFGGSANTNRLYGCDGKNRGFEFDGTVFVPIDTGMTTDRPEHVWGHRNHLFFSFLGSVQHSSIGFPYMWSALTGASELAMGDTVTGFMQAPGASDSAALAIFTRNSIGILYGTSSADWNLSHYKKSEAGAIAHTIQQIGNILMLDDRGLVSLATSQVYGNFADSILSNKVKSWLRTRTATASCILRDRNQYCLFFSDGNGLYVTIDNKKIKGMMPVVFDHVVKCIDSYENSSGNEEVYFGDEDGYVYQMEKGTSFDGGAIEAYITLALNHSKTPTTIKRYRKATLEISGTGYYEFQFSYDLDYSSTETEQPGSTLKAISLTASRWDGVDVAWDSASFIWDGASLSPSYLDMGGTGVNVSLKIQSNGDYFNQTTITSAIIQYAMLREKR